MNEGLDFFGCCPFSSLILLLFLLSKFFWSKAFNRCLWRSRMLCKELGFRFLPGYPEADSTRESCTSATAR